MDSILSDEPSVHSLPESDSPPSAAEEPVSTKADTKPDAAQQATPPNPAGKAGDVDGDDEPDAPIPDNLEEIKKALAAERKDGRRSRKERKESDRRIAMLEGELQAFKQQRASQAQPAKPEPKPEELEAEIYKDLPGYLQRQRQQMQQEFEQKTLATRLQLSEAMARRAHTDFDEKIAAVKEAAAGNPMLVQYAFQQPDPAEYLYRTGAKLLLDKEIGDDPAAYRQRLEAEVRAKIEAEMAANGITTPTTQAPTKPSPTKSIAGSRGNGAGVTQAWSGPRSLEDVLA